MFVYVNAKKFYWADSLNFAVPQVFDALQNNTYLVSAILTDKSISNQPVVYQFKFFITRFKKFINIRIIKEQA